MIANSSPSEAPFTPDPALQYALPRFRVLLALRRAGLKPDPTFGDFAAHARVVFFHFPWLQEPLTALWPKRPKPPPSGPDPSHFSGPEDDSPGQELPTPDILVGTSGTTTQFGLLGRTVAPDGSWNGPRSESVFHDTNGTEFYTISGANGSGKTSSLAVIIENGSIRIRNLNRLRRPSCTVLFVLHNNNREILDGRVPNSDPRAVRELLTVHGAAPRALPNLKRLVLPKLLNEALREYPGIPTLPAWLPPGQLGARGFELAMGLSAHRDTRYASTTMRFLAELRQNASLAGIRELADANGVQGKVRLTLDEHLELGAHFIKDDAADLDVIEEGAVIVVEIRDPWLTDEKRVILATVLLDVLQKQAYRKGIHVLFAFDEAHHILRSQVLLQALEVLIKERRHLKLSVALLGLDMIKLPEELLALASIMLIHRSPSEENLKHHGRAHPRWRLANAMRMSLLPEGQAYLLTTGGKFARGLEHFMERPRILQVRDRVSQHGGNTKTVV
jgi:hypothetical protein